jgi:uncharacterized protein
MKRLLTTVTLIIFGTQVNSADWCKEYVGFDRGYCFEFNNDYISALKIMKPLAEKGHPGAQQRMGYMYQYGTGVLKDYTEALRWYRKSAEQGKKEAQADIGVIYENGLGVLKDNLTAHMWYNIASANGGKNASRWRDELEAKMTSIDISKATAMARECMASDYKKCGY